MLQREISILHHYETASAPQLMCSLLISTTPSQTNSKKLSAKQTAIVGTKRTDVSEFWWGEV